jgi:uncharacterized protein YbcI
VPDLGPGTEQVKAQIAREISEVHLESYGEPVRNVAVESGERFIAVVMDIVLSPAEHLLIDGGRRDTVRTLREEYQLVIEPVYTAVIERASGRRVDGFASRTVVDGEGPPWASEVFRLGAVG